MSISAGLRWLFRSSKPVADMRLGHRIVADGLTHLSLYCDTQHRSINVEPDVRTYCNDLDLQTRQPLELPK